LSERLVDLVLTGTGSDEPVVFEVSVALEAYFLAVMACFLLEGVAARPWVYVRHLVLFVIRHIYPEGFACLSVQFEFRIYVFVGRRVC